jgi:hypothetical protein
VRKAGENEEQPSSRRIDVAKIAATLPEMATTLQEFSWAGRKLATLNRKRAYFRN